MTGSDTPLEYLAEYGAMPESEPTYEPVLYWLWMAHLLGPGSSHAGTLLDTYGSACALWEDRDTEQFRKNIGLSAWKRWKKQPTTPADYVPLWEECQDSGIQILTFEDADYPLALSRIPDPPLVLYCTGDVRHLNTRYMVGMVGTRKPTSYGISAAQDIGTALAESGAVIVSGLADGLDGVSHRAAIKAGAPTIGVLGVPINKTFPSTNTELRWKMEENGTVISEYAPGANCDYRVTFLQRNRIIAALSMVLVVLEAREHSGTMSTVNHAQRYGRPVYAVPGSIYSPLSIGTNALLKSGKARMVTGANDILEQMGLARENVQEKAPALCEAPKPELSPNARKVLGYIGARPVGLEELTEKTGMPIGALLVALTSLELSGWILSQPGQRYILK